jgi:hypothetical protein
MMLGAAVMLSAAVAGSTTAGAAPTADACLVPQLTGTPLNVARQVLPWLGCQLGTVTRSPSISVDENAVIRTTPPAGKYRLHRVIDLVVAGSPAGLRSGAITGNGTNADPYTGSCQRVDGDCRITFANRDLQLIFDHEYVPAYRCPESDPWLLKKTVTQGRIVPPGVLFQAHYGTLGVSITGVSKKEGKTEQRGTKVYVFEYSTGTLTGFPNSSVTNWGFGGAIYGISIYCTSDLKQANLVNVRG